MTFQVEPRQADNCREKEGSQKIQFPLRAEIAFARVASKRLRIVGTTWGVTVVHLSCVLLTAVAATVIEFPLKTGFHSKCWISTPELWTIWNL